MIDVRIAKMKKSYHSNTVPAAEAATTDRIRRGSTSGSSDAVG